MKKLSEKILAFEHSPIRKFAPFAKQAEADGTKVYYLNIGQPDIETPPVFMDAIRNYDEPVIGYAPSNGIPDLIEAMVGYYSNYNVAYTKEQIIVTEGASEALSMIMTAICNDGDEILTPEPYYSNYEAFVSDAGGVIKPITTSTENEYHYADIDRIRPLIRNRTKAILLTNPGNPTGTVLTRDEMQEILELALEYDIFVIADEVYREFVYDGLESISFGEFEEFAERIILVDSVSKRFSACGARIGSIACKNRVLMNNLTKIAQSRLSVSTLDQVGSTALYSIDPSYFQGIREEYRTRRDVTYDELTKIEGIVCSKPKSSFYIMAKLPVIDAEEFLLWMLKEFRDNDETVLFSPGSGFYATPGLGSDEIRVACMLNVDDMRRGVELIRLGLDKYKEIEQPE